ncbi:MAG: class I SAM-dependent methyltransferase [Acidobacteria bacterium]|nr:MAG: class I SAM-dependent methyltransferase [Acidobacteriota bacterium]
MTGRSEVPSDPVRRRLLDELWNTDHRYYELARQHVRAAAQRPGEYDFLRERLPASGDILEVGCGEGSNMEVLAAPGRRFVGCDLSALALRLATDSSPVGGTNRFVRGEGEALPFPDATFCAVMGISLLEHLPHPETAIAEMARVLAPGGTLLLLSPQYGGPLGASPCRQGGGPGRFLRRFLRAHLPRRGSEMGWERVAPTVLEGAAYDGDRDAVIEPELTGLVRYLSHLGLELEVVTSGLEWATWLDYPGSLPQQLARAICERLGRLGLAPYRHFGPVVAVAARRPPVKP